MRVIYIAGPYRAKTGHLVEQNIRRAEKAMEEVAALGLVPLCPHTMTRHFDGTFTDEYWLGATLELMFRCDALVLVDGWERSAGTLGELQHARHRGMRIFESVSELAATVAA